MEAGGEFGGSEGGVGVRGDGDCDVGGGGDGIGDVESEVGIGAGEISAVGGVPCEGVGASETVVGGIGKVGDIGGIDDIGDGDGVAAEGKGAIGRKEVMVMFWRVSPTSGSVKWEVKLASVKGLGSFSTTFLEALVRTGG